MKDAIMMGAALVTMADSAKAYLAKRGGAHGEPAMAQGGQLSRAASVECAV